MQNLPLGSKFILIDMTISKKLPRKSGPKTVLLARTDLTKRNTGSMVGIAWSWDRPMTKMGKDSPTDALDNGFKAYKDCQKCLREKHVTFVLVNLSDTPGNGPPKKTDSSPVMKKDHANANFTNVTSWWHTILSPIGLPTVTTTTCSTLLGFDPVVVSTNHTTGSKCPSQIISSWLWPLEVLWLQIEHFIISIFIQCSTTSSLLKLPISSMGFAF